MAAAAHLIDESSDSGRSGQCSTEDARGDAVRATRATDLPGEFPRTDNRRDPANRSPPGGAYLHRSERHVGNVGGAAVGHQPPHVGNATTRSLISPPRANPMAATTFWHSAATRGHAMAVIRHSLRRTTAVAIAALTAACVTSRREEREPAVPVMVAEAPQIDSIPVASSSLAAP